MNKIIAATALYAVFLSACAGDQEYLAQRRAACSAEGGTYRLDKDKGVMAGVDRLDKDHGIMRCVGKPLWVLGPGWKDL